MRITVSGAPGTGTSTLSRILSQELGIRWINSGDLFRQIAAERRVSLAELGRIAERGPEIDYQIDDAMRASAREGPGIFEGRITGYILAADLKILLKSDIKVRAARIAAREGKLLEDALRESRVREESEARRYLKYYNVNASDPSIYDLVVDTGRWNEAGIKEIVMVAIGALR